MIDPFTSQPPTPEPNEPRTENVPPVAAAPQEPAKKKPTGPNVLFIVLLSLAAGFVGGTLGSSEGGSLWDMWRTQTETPLDVGEKALPPLFPEDQSTVSVVERSTPAVVSVVVTKDVPRVRNFFRSPFGFPFFSDPYTSDGDSDDESGSTRQQVGSGSGFFASSDGYIVTNKHVVSDAQAEYTVITNDGTELAATVLALDPVNDIAVIKVDGTGYPSLPLGDSDILRVGQTAIAIGNPLGEFANSVSRGIISGLERSVIAGGGTGGAEELRNIIQTDAAINPGNSGGPLLNLSGEVVGVNVAVAQGVENIGFAIPVNQIKRAVDEVRRTGKITAPYIGVRYIIIDEALAQEANLPVEYGALIQRGDEASELAVIPGSPADKAGLQENDIILEIDGTRVDADNPLASIVSQKKVGDEVRLKVWSDGETRDVTLRLEERTQ